MRAHSTAAGSPRSGTLALTLSLNVAAQQPITLHGAVYFNVLANGTPYLLGNERLKGSHSMSGYHSFELCYLAATESGEVAGGAAAAIYGSRATNGVVVMAGGLTTILEKSLGAVAKGGTTDMVDVYKYAEPITTHGLRSCIATFSSVMLNVSLPSASVSRAMPGIMP